MYLCGTICGDYASSHSLSVDRSFVYERDQICFAFINLYYVMMDISRVLKLIDSQDGLSQSLGMEFLSTPEPNTCKARMKVDHRNRQPFGFLSGGASLALAENIAGVGSLALCPGKISVGINVSGSHVKAVMEGDVVEATATLLHKGRTLHTWQVDIRNSNQELISTVSVTNYIIKPQSASNTSGKSK